MIRSEAILLIINVILSLLPCYALLLIPFRHRLRFKGWPLVLVGVAYLLIATLVSLFVFMEHGKTQSNEFISAFCSFSLALFISLLVVKHDPLQILFVVGIMGCYNDNMTLLTKLFQLFLPGVTPLDYNHFTYSVGYILFLLVTFPILFRIIKNWMIPLFEVSGNASFWKYLWLIPTLFYSIYHIAIYNEFITLYQHRYLSRAVALPLVWVIMTLLVLYTVMKLVVETERTTRKEQELRFADDILVMQSQQYNQFKTSTESIRVLKHDFRHELLILKQYVDENNEADIKRYLDKALGTLESDSLEHFAENGAVDLILKHYIGTARQQGIRITTAIDIPEIIPIKEIDYCVLLSNIVENAVEACLRQQSGPRFIDIKAATTGDKMLVLTVTNSYDGEIIRDGERFRSSKRDTTGIGTTSIRKIAQRHDGHVKFSYDGHIFSVSVFLNPQSICEPTQQ